MDIISADQQQILTASFSILPIADEHWSAFLNKQPKINIFHHPAWSQLIAECYDFHPFVGAVYDSNGEIMAGLPLMEINSWLTGRRWVSLPFTDHCAPLFTNADAISSLMGKLFDNALVNGIYRMELRGEYPPCSHFRQISPYVLHTLQLSNDYTVIEKHINSMHRRNAKNALKRGVHIEMGNKPHHIRDFYHLHIETRKKQGVPVQPWRFFDLLEKNLLEKNLGFVLLAYHEETVIAGMVLLGWGHVLTYKYGASRADSLKLRPNDLLFLTAIRWGCENGYKVLDLGRTDIDNKGLRAFKSLWGADETLLSYSVPREKPVRESKGKLMALINTMLRKSPSWVSRVAGELFYKHFG